MNKNIYILLLIVVIISISLFVFRDLVFRKSSDIKPPNVSDGKVKLIIMTEYNEYFIDQDIWLKVSVVNNSNENYYLKLPLNRSYIYFKGVYPSEKIVTDSFTVDPGEIKDSLKILPGNSYEKVVSLNPVNEKFFRENGKETGIYSLIAGYQDLLSNELSIPVILPSGDDKELYEQTFGSLFGQEVSDYDKAVKLGELLKKYPATKYSPQLYNIFFRESDFVNDYNRASENMSDFFEYNNDTYGAELILDIGNHNMEKLSSKYRDTKTGYLIRQKKKEALTHK